MYASVDQLRAYLSQTSTNSANDALLEAVLTRATDMVRSAIRAAIPDPLFDYAAYGAASTRIVQGYPTTMLPLPAHQPGSVTLVEQETIASPPTYAAIADTWIETDSRLYRAGVWWFARYRVTAVWGYGPVPPAVEELTLELAVNLWRAKDKGGYSEIVGVEGSGGVRVVAGLNSQQRMIVDSVIAPYRVAAL